METVCYRTKDTLLILPEQDPSSEDLLMCQLDGSDTPSQAFILTSGSCTLWKWSPGGRLAFLPVYCAHTAGHCRYLRHAGEKKQKVVELCLAVVSFYRMMIGQIKHVNIMWIGVAKIIHVKGKENLKNSTFPLSVPSIHSCNALLLMLPSPSLR